MASVRAFDPAKACALALSVCLVLGCITRGEFEPFERSVWNLEVGMKRIDGRLTNLEQEASDSLGAVRMDQADLKADMIEVRSEIQAMRGDLSSGLHEREVAGQAQQSTEESVALQLSYLQQQMERTEARLVRIEQYFGIKPPPAVQPDRRPPPQVPAPQPPATVGEEPAAQAAPAPPPPKELSPEEAYDMAYHLWKSNQYEAARKAFEQFLLRYPESSLVDNALFWTGETYYRTGNFENAVLYYQQVITKYPKGSKGPDALLKMGYALEKMNEPGAAIAAMEKLVKSYPNAPQASLATRKIEQLKSDPTGPQTKQGQ